MIVGVPKEIKADEYRVAMLPVGVEELTAAGHAVLIEAGAGQGSGITDAQYVAAGATLVDGPDGDLVAGRPRGEGQGASRAEWPGCGPARWSSPTSTSPRDEALTGRSSTVASPPSPTRPSRDPKGSLPLLTADERGRRADEHPGRGEVSRTAAGRARHPAGGRAGRGPGGCRPSSAAASSASTPPRSPRVSAPRPILDVNLDRLRYLDDIMPAERHHRSTPTGTRSASRSSAPTWSSGPCSSPAPGPPRLVRREDLKRMKPGAVIVDVAIDQGGCIETSRPTTHRQPTFIVDGVVHYCVTNMPGAVGRTSTYALGNVTLPYVLLRQQGWRAVAEAYSGVAEGVNMDSGRVTNRGRCARPLGSLATARGLAGHNGRVVQVRGLSQWPRHESGHRFLQTWRTPRWQFGATEAPGPGSDILQCLDSLRTPRKPSMNVQRERVRRRPR